jgi:hypothetical protein
MTDLPAPVQDWLDSYEPLLRAVAVLAPLVGALLPGIVTGELLYAGVGAVGVAAGVVAWRLDRPAASVAGAVVGVLAVVAFWSPMLHGPLYALLVESVASWYWLGVGLAIAGVGAALSWGFDQPAGTLLVLVGLVVGVAGFAFVGPFVSGVYAHEHVADEVGAEAAQLDGLPESRADRNRVVPQAVAENWATNSLQYPQYTVTGGDITYIDGTPYWSYSLSPNGFVNTLTKRQRGAVYVNQSSTSKDIVIHDEQRFKYGQGVAVTDNFRWQLVRDNFWADYQEPFVVPHQGESYLATPKICHEWRFRLLPVPQPYSVPTFCGVSVMDQNGNVDDLSPTQAADSAVLDGQNFYPYDLAMYRVKSMAWQKGALNVWFSHEDQLEVAPVPGDGNSQPFTVPTTEGVQYFVAAEPWGNANGIYQLWTVDAQTGEMGVYELPKASALRGPRKAVESVMADPAIAPLNDVRGVEPIPVVRNGRLYWEVRVVPDSSARITYVAFFDAASEDVTIVETTSQVRAFLAGQQPGGPDPGGDGDGQAGENETITVVIEYPDGSTERINVPKGSTVSVQTGNASAGGNQSARLRATAR